MDWMEFLQQHNIPYRDHGKSTAKNNVYVSCPFCADPDGDTHMGISLKGKGWGCWKNGQHRGKSNAKLIQALLDCDWKTATELGGGDTQTIVDQDELLNIAQNFNQPRSITRTNDHELKLPDFYRSLSYPSSMAQTFRDYIAERQFREADIPKLIKTYDLRYSLKGDFSYRIILPVINNGKLHTWTGRSVISEINLRYKTLSPEREFDGCFARGPITNYLFCEDELFAGGDCLIVCEGPFDALKLDFYGRKYGVRTTCVFGKALTETQKFKLMEIGRGFRRRYVMLDSGAELDGVGFAMDLSSVGYRVLHQVKGYKDAGALPSAVAASFCRRLAA